MDAPRPPLRNRQTREAKAMNRLRRPWVCAILWMAVGLAGPIPAVAEEGLLGYPRPFSFRSVTAKQLPYLDWMTMVVSDLHVRTRAGAEIEFKSRYPSRPVLVQINSEGLGLWGTWICLPQQMQEDLGLRSEQSVEIFEEFSKGIYPTIDFPGYWVYEAGADSTASIPADATQVTVGVTEVSPFLPSSHPHSVNRLKRPEFAKDIVICPRDVDGQLNWLAAEFATVTGVDEGASSVTLRRWNSSASPRRACPAGTYLAPNANLIAMPGFPAAWCRYLDLREVPYMMPFLPNLTRFCPKDPRTGLNAAEWLARHYIGVKRQHYPTLDGYVFDVSAGTFHPSTRISLQSDCDVDGVPDYFYFNGIDHWALGMHDFFSYLRDGSKGKFEGLGSDVAIVSDANSNDEARFFDLLNGAEYEFGMVNPFRPRTHQYSSNLDRYLLWCTRARTPRLSYIHHKFPTDTYHGGTEEDLEFYMHDNYYRLDVATACMGTGFVGSAVSRPGGHPAVAIPQRKEQMAQYGTPLPLDWDEYHGGTARKRNWLGMPFGEPVRLVGHLKRIERGEQDGRSKATLEVDYPCQARILESPGPGSICVDVAKVMPWHDTGFKIRLQLPVGQVQKDREYTVKFAARAPCPYARIDPKYASIPRNVNVRLAMGKSLGLAQEALVFSQPRAVYLTLTAPASGAGRLEFGLAEEPGEITFYDVELYEGCADVMYRPFEHGLALLNGSAISPFDFDMVRLLPGESCVRIEGRQDPAHNSGRPVDGPLTLGPRDGILLRRP